MSRFMIAALVALVSFAPAPAAVPTTVRIHIDGTGVSSREIQQMTDAPDRGLYADSLSVRPAARVASPSPTANPGQFGDSGKGAIYLLSGAVRADSTGLVVSLNLVNVLAKPVVPRATLRVDRAAIDSTLTAQGQAFARILPANANRRR